jgi:MYXO-CTERM domain-containing protein
MPAPFAIHVVDRAGAPAPCVTLRTTDAQRFLTDADGWIAFDEPGLLGDEVWFHVESDHYDVPADFFGYEGVVLSPLAGGLATVTVDRRSAPGRCRAPAQLPAILDGFPEVPFDLHVVDAATLRGIPLVRVVGPTGELWTDNAGHVAVRDPGLLDTEVTFTFPALHGYREGAALTLTPTAGGSATVELARDNVSERLYRITGRGAWRDSVLLGLPTPVSNPVANGRVMGQDTILTLPWNGDWLWMWGDTNRPDYPLGLFDMAGAVARPLVDPSEGIELDYFVDPATGFVRAMAPIPGDGPTWLAAPVVVDDGGTPVTIAFYGNFAQDLSANERGLAILDERDVTFRKDRAFPDPRLAVTTNRPIVRDGWVYLTDGMRFPATLAGARDLTTWELRSPRLPDGTLDTWPDGATRWDWRTDVTLRQLDVPEDVLIEHATGEVVHAHGDSVAWSAWRHRWVRVFTEVGGTSWLGEMWYTEADTPYGPWGRAAKIASHTTYTAYNPMVHPELSGDGRRLLWQVTYTGWLATDDLTPRYDYNQLMYRLDLDEPRVVLPTPVYDLGDRLGTIADLRPADGEPTTVFLAPDRPFDGAVPMGWDGPACDGGHLVAGTPLGTPVFWMAPEATTDAVPLWRATDGVTEGWFVDVPAPHTADPAPAGWVWPVGDDARTGVSAWLPEVRVDAGEDRCVAEDEAGAGAVVALDASASPGVVGGAWSITLDGAEVATDPVADVVVPAGRHVVAVVWTSPEGTPFVDEVLVAVAEGPPAPEEHTGNTTPTPTETGDTADPEPSPPPAAAKGCGCASGGAPLPWLWVGAALVALRRRR